MKLGGPTPSSNAAPVQRVPVEPKDTPVDLTQNEPNTSYDSQREKSDRQKRAEPEVQDGSYGFAAKEDEMEVDNEILGVEKPENNHRRAEFRRPHIDRRDIRDRDHRVDRRDSRYDSPRDGGRGRPYFDREREGGRPRNDYRLHSDDMYPRPRGRGFR